MKVETVRVYGKEMRWDGSVGSWCRSDPGRRSQDAHVDAVYAMSSPCPLHLLSYTMPMLPFSLETRNEAAFAAGLDGQGDYKMSRVLESDQ